jgi:hypothetical protein
VSEHPTKSRSCLYLGLLGVVIGGIFIYVRVRPVVLVTSQSSHRFGGYIRVVETPTSRLEAILLRDNFESEDDFATVDVPTAVRVMEIAMTDTPSIPLRQKLSGIPIDWLT